MRCPERCDLYAFLDGELSEAAFAVVDRHQLECSTCRDEIRRIKVFQRSLFQGLAPVVSAENETNDAEAFLDGLMTRLVENDLGRGAVVRRFRLTHLLSAVCGLLVVLTAATMILRPRRTIAIVPAVEQTEAVALVRESARRVEVARAEAEFVQALMKPLEAGRWSWRLWSARFDEAGTTLAGAVERILRRETPEHRAEIARRLPMDLGFAATGVLSRLANDDSVIVRREVCAAFGRMRSQGSFSAIRAAARDDVDAGVALEAMLSLRSASGDEAVDAFARGRFERDSGGIMAVLSRRSDVRTTRLLADIYFDGSQSALLVDALRSRPATVGIARATAFDESKDERRRERAILMLGECNDRASVARLERFLSSRTLASAAAATIARIGGEPAMLMLAQRLQPRRSDVADVAIDPRQEALERAIANFGNDGARFYLSRIARGGDGYQAHYVVAAGIAGDAQMIPNVEALLDDDLLKVYAAQSLGRIADRSDDIVLVKLSKSRDGRIRDHAIDMMRKRGLRPTPVRRGFADSSPSEPSRPISEAASGRRRERGGT